MWWRYSPIVIPKKNNGEHRRGPFCNAQVVVEGGVDAVAKPKYSAQVKKRIKELKDAFQTVDADRMRVINNAIEEVAYMEEKLAQIKVEIDRIGFVEEYQNGENQYGTKESTASKAYNTLLKNYNSYIRTLIQALPETKDKETDDGFEEFLGTLKK